MKSTESSNSNVRIIELNHELRGALTAAVAEIAEHSASASHITAKDKLEAWRQLYQGTYAAGSSNQRPRGAHRFEACADGALIIYATLPNEDGEPIRIEPHQVAAVLAACGDFLARKPSNR